MASTANLTQSNSRRPCISFELMPPRNPDAAPKFWTTATKLIATKPDFISVTYGAAGKDRDTARTVVSRIAKYTPTVPIAHLTCVGANTERLTAIVNEFLDEGIRSFLALRGDPPVNYPDWKPDAASLGSSDALISLIKEIEAQRCNAHPGDALRGTARPLTIVVAAFPGGNAAAGTTRAQEVQRLFEKQQAGAHFAITQLFYEPETYIDFVADARAAGVHIPIVAGVLPFTEPHRLRRTESLMGIKPPARLVEKLESFSSEQAQFEFGIEASVEFAQSVLAAGAPGLHIYTFNKYQAALSLLSGLGLDRGQEESDIHLPDLSQGPWVQGVVTPA